MDFFKGLTLCMAASAFALAFFVSEVSAASVCNSKTEFTPGTYDCQGEDVELGSRTPYNSVWDYRFKPYLSGGTFTFKNVGEWRASVYGSGISGSPCTDSPHYGGPGSTVTINAKNVNVSGSFYFSGGWGCSDRPEFGYSGGTGGNGGFVTINSANDIFIGGVYVRGGSGRGGESNAPPGDIRLNAPNGIIKTNQLVAANSQFSGSDFDPEPGGNIYLTGGKMIANYINVYGTEGGSIQSSGSKCVYPGKRERAGKLIVKGGSLVVNNWIDARGLGEQGLVDLKQVADVRTTSLRLGGDGGCYRPGGKGFSCVERCYDSGSTLRVRDNVCISPTGCAGQPSGRTPFPGGISYGAPVFSFGAICGSGTTEVDGQCVGTGCGPGTAQVDGQCVISTQKTTIDFHGRAIDKMNNNVIKSGTVEFSVKDGDNVVWNRPADSNMIENGLFNHVVGGTGDPQLNLMLGNQYTLTVNVCGDGLNCEEFNIPFVA